MIEGRDRKTKDEKNLEFHRKKAGSLLHCLVNLIPKLLRLIAIQIPSGILEGSRNH